MAVSEWILPSNAGNSSALLKKDLGELGVLIEGKVSLALGK